MAPGIIAHEILSGDDSHWYDSPVPTEEEGRDKMEVKVPQPETGNALTLPVTGVPPQLLPQRYT